MCATDPLGQFLKFFQINVFTLVLDLLSIVFVAEMPDNESDRGGNNQNDEVPIANRIAIAIAIAVFNSYKISKHKNDY